MIFGVSAKPLPDHVEDKLKDKPARLSHLNYADKLLDDGDFESAAYIYRLIFNEYENVGHMAKWTSWHQHLDEISVGSQYFNQYSNAFAKFCEPSDGPVSKIPFVYHPKRFTSHNAFENSRAFSLERAVARLRRYFPIERSQIDAARKQSISDAAAEFLQVGYKSYYAANEEPWKVFFKFVALGHSTSEKNMRDWMIHFMSLRREGLAITYYQFDTTQKWSACTVLAALTEFIHSRDPHRAL